MTAILPTYDPVQRASLRQVHAALRAGVVGEEGSAIFSIEHVGGVGGNFAGEPQGLAFDVTNQMLYGMSNNSGAREVKKINLSGTTLATSSNQGGSTLSIQDGAVVGQYVYVPRTNAGVGNMQRFDLDLNYVDQTAIPASVNLTPAAAYAHGSWWFTKSTIPTIYKVSADLTTIEGTFDISSGHNSSYSGLAWYGNYLFGAEHTLGSQLDIWYWNGTTLTLHQQISTSGLDLYNGLAIDETNNKLYASSRSLADDIQIYNINIQ